MAASRLCLHDGIFLTARNLERLHLVEMLHLFVRHPWSYGRRCRSTGSRLPAEVAEP